MKKIYALIGLCFSLASHAQSPILRLHLNESFQEAVSEKHTWKENEKETYRDILSQPYFRNEEGDGIADIFSPDQLRQLKDALEILPAKNPFRGGDGEYHPERIRPDCNGFNNPLSKFNVLSVDYLSDGLLYAGGARTKGVFGVTINACGTHSTAMFIDDLSRVGFGTDMPQSHYHFHKLDLQVGDHTGFHMKAANESILFANGSQSLFKVNKDGKVYAREFEVTLGAFPDYVFDKDYPLLTLNEVDAYISKHKHLPGIPSATEYEKEGVVKIGELQTKLLEKIEELTLYAIEQQKMLEKQQQEIHALKQQIAK